MVKATGNTRSDGKLEITGIFCDHGKSISGPNSYVDRLGMFCGEAHCPCRDESIAAQHENQAIMDSLTKIFGAN